MRTRGLVTGLSRLSPPENPLTCLSSGAALIPRGWGLRQSNTPRAGYSSFPIHSKMGSFSRRLDYRLHSTTGYE